MALLSAGKGCWTAALAARRATDSLGLCSHVCIARFFSAARPARACIQVSCALVHTEREHSHGWRGCGGWGRRERATENQYRAGVCERAAFEHVLLITYDAFQFGAQVLDVLELPLGAFDTGDLKEGFDLFMLMQVRASSRVVARPMYCARHAQQLADVDHMLSDKVNREAYSEADHAAYWFFQRNMCRVEMVRDFQLERMYFPRPVISNYLTKLTKDGFVWQVDRTSPQAKVDGLFNAAADFLDEMQHQVRWLRLRRFARLWLALICISRAD